MPASLSDRGAAEFKALSELRSSLKAAQVLDCYELRAGISKAFFSRLLVEALFNAKTARETLARYREQFAPSPVLRKKSVRTALRRVRDEGMPGMVKKADEYLNLNQSLRRLGKPYIDRADKRVELLHPILILYALFRHLVKRRGADTLKRRFVPDYFPKILRAADIGTSTGIHWTPTNIDRHYRRAGGEKAMLRVAGLLLSTDPVLRRYRPRPTFKRRKGIRPMMGEYILAIRGRALYRVDPFPSPPSRKHSAGRTLTAQNGPRLSA